MALDKDSILTSYIIRDSKGASRRYVDFICLVCGKNFPKRLAAVRRAIKIRGSWITDCKECSLERTSKLLSEYNRNNVVRGKLKACWKGGRYKDNKGYWHVRIYEDDQFFPMTNPYGYVLEHRYLMANKMSRCLEKWEVVHHKNQDRGDNRIDNLELLSKTEHILVTKMEIEINSLKDKIKELEIKIDKLSW